jgi:hypothetical protein
MAVMDYVEVDLSESVLGQAKVEADDLIFLPDSGLVENWKELKLNLVEGDFTDYLLSDESLRICSEKMREILDRGALRGDRLQWLPARVATRGGKSRPYYVLHFPDLPDILDCKHSTVINTMVVKPVFRAEALSDHGVFSYRKGGDQSLFVNASTKQRLEDEGCTGLEFSPAKVFPPAPTSKKLTKGEVAAAKRGAKSKTGAAKAAAARKTRGPKESRPVAGKTPTLARMSKDVLGIGNQAKDPISGYQALLVYLATYSTKAAILALEGANLDKDVASIRAELAKLRDKEPPPRRVKAVYFGLFDSVNHRGQESVGFYVTGHEEYDEHDPDSLCEPIWEPEGRYLRSQVLRQVKMAAMAAGARGDGGAQSLLGYAGQFGVAILLAKFASNALLKEGMRCVVGFDSGDVVEVSKLA